MTNFLIVLGIILVVGASFMFISASKLNEKQLEFSNAMSQTEKDHWFAGKAEVSSYDLSQSRYGVNRKGSAVLIFVTEPFSSSEYVKADNPSNRDISVLKLNAVKKFNTGIYPYSIMTSTFFPFEGNGHALKVTNSIQEWCGHTYSEFLNKDRSKIKVNSYFEGETKNVDLEKVLLEDELWTMLKINPLDIPTGDLDILPSSEYLSLFHKSIKNYKAHISNKEGVLKLNIPELNRTLSISYDVKFPYQIFKWTESTLQVSGLEQTTTAILKKAIMVDYWNKSTEADSTYRKELGLVDY